ncbi:LysM peptidoglycan-binding domain-containing protein [Moraxella cuniculi]|uniref:Membrane-bound lytic murein transglycosylase D n=1 Tax=Moraxella cuniculi TaxID=34061 RepID=A0A448GY33_9GAMM|nr:LysM peptidoglycan-binding domain-containing protein [Moraxella cuniculi]VEG13598.1 Membrane-bound lytic murein transglycosylase D precursor [Moraxella cuniculi]
MTKFRQAKPSQHLLKPLSLAISSCILVACSSTGTNKPASTPAVLPTPQSPIVITQPSTDANTSGVLNPDMLDALESLLQATDMSMVEGDELAVKRYGDLWDRIRRGYRIGEINNARIESQKSWFYTRQSYLNRLTARASRYLYHTVAEAERRGIPSELALLPIIESSYDPSATSNAAAAGLWQFIPSTGRIYGLNQSQSYDGRRDVIESTRAAYDFLTSLYNQFGSWELALAAYNAGPGRVSRAIKANQEQGLPTDYWSLKLPTETMNYVPRFLAVAQIVKSPNTYGIYLPAIANHNHFRTVPVNYGVSLTEVATVTGISTDELRLLNPALLNQIVDEIGPNRIVIPDSLPSSVDAQLSALKGFGFGGDYIATAPAQSISYVAPKTGAAVNASSEQELIASNTLPTTIAQVTPNNTIVQEPPLSAAERDFIAAQIEASASEPVQAINPQDGNIQLDAVQTGQSVLDARGETKTLQFTNNPQTVSAEQLPPAQNHTQPAQEPEPAQTPVVSASRQNTTARPKAEQSKPKPTRPDSYTVRAGDSLTSVAAANGLSVGQLASYNNLATDAHIRIGQKLWLVAGKVKPQTTTTNNQTNSTQNTRNTATATHRVQSGESLTAIARKYNISLQALANENNLAITDGVLIGQVLRLPAGVQAQATTSQQPTRPDSYTVRAGDSLTSVAAANGLSVGQLASYNNLATDAHIRIGQKLWLVAGKVKPQTTTTNNQTNSTQNTRNTATATHRVQSGESLTAIARKYNISLQALANENNLAITDGVLIGQVLRLPAGVQATSTVNSTNANNPSSQSPSNATENYTVKAGDSLTSLANRFGVSIASLAAANNLSTNANLIIGQSIKVPKLTSNYTVKAGDGLISLARRYGTSVAELAKMNNLQPTDSLRIGQVLLVPNK